MKCLTLLFLAAASTHLGRMAAQTLNWATPGSPTGRCCMSMAYDGATHSTVLFGGALPRQNFGDTWILSGGWIQTPPANSPSPRLGSAIAYDAAAGSAVLFGGTTATQNVVLFGRQ